MMLQDLHAAVAAPFADDWRLRVMTSALAAALRELDRSRDALERELAHNPDYIDWRRLGGSPADGSDTQRRGLLARLEQLPVFRALQGIAASRDLIEGGDAVVAEEQRARNGLKAAVTTATPPVAPQVVPQVVPQVLQMPSFTPPDGPAQPLTAIRGLSTPTARQLEAMGIRRYEQIAAWSAADVRAVAAGLGLGRDISRGNWIEKAALLAMRDGLSAMVPVASAPLPPVEASSAPVRALVIVAPTVVPAVSAAGATQPAAGIAAARHAASAAVAGAERARERNPGSPVVTVAKPPIASFGPVFADAAGFDPIQRISCRPDAPPIRRPVHRVANTAGPDTVPPEAAAPPVDAAPAAAAERLVVVPVVRAAPDDLRDIQGLDERLAARLIHSGCVSLRAIAAWTAADVARIAEQLDIPTRRISREGWIEQAAVLASGRPTRYAIGRARGEFGALAPLPPAPPAPVAPPRPAASPRAMPALPAASPAATPAVVRAIVAIPAADRPPVVVTMRTAVPPVIAAPPQLSLSSRIERTAEPDHAGEAVASVLPRRMPSPFAGLAPAPDAAANLVRAAATPDAAADAATPLAPAPAPAEPMAGMGAMSSPARPERFSASAEPSGENAAGHRWTAPAASEEALVEIIRREDPLAPGSGGAVAKAAIDRSAQRGAGQRGALAAGTQPARTPLPQPEWVADRDAEAGGVMRRFMKALKRDS